MRWEAFWSPIGLSLQVTLISSIVVTVLGGYTAWVMTHRSFKGKLWIETAIMLPLVLPPTVVGFLLLVLLGRNSPVGRFHEWLYDQPIVFSWGAAVLASIVVAFPLVYQTLKTGFRSVDITLEEAGRSIGANEWQVFRYITLPLVSRSLVTAYVLGFARGVGEFGATLMIAGNIPGKTQTIPTAIYVAVETGDTAMAWAWTIAIVAISFVLLLFTQEQPFIRNKEKS